MKVTIRYGLQNITHALLSICYIIADSSHIQVIYGPNRNPRILLPTLEDVQNLAQSCPKLKHVYSNFSRLPSFGTALWLKGDDGMWNGSIEIPDDPFDFTVNQHM